MGPQRETFIQKEGVLHAARGMPRRYPQGREVEVIGLDFGSLGDAIAQADEEVHHVVDDPLRGVQVSPRYRYARERDVHRLRPQTVFALREGDLGPARLQVLFDLARREVGRPSDLFTVLG